MTDASDSDKRKRCNHLSWLKENLFDINLEWEAVSDPLFL